MHEVYSRVNIACNVEIFCTELNLMSIFLEKIVIQIPGFRFTYPHFDHLCARTHGDLSSVMLNVHWVISKLVLVSVFTVQNVH
jgi:hypothetical protein